jgi:hypothetical protein
MAITPWLHYADHPLAPTCRSPPGSYMPIGDTGHLLSRWKYFFLLVDAPSGCAFFHESLIITASTFARGALKMTGIGSRQLYVAAENRRSPR